MSRPIILMDVDGILANFVQQVLDNLSDHVVHHYDHDDIRHWETFESMPDLAGLRGSVYQRFRSPGGCFEITTYPGAIEGVRALRALGDIVFVTSPMAEAPTWMSEREDWLRHHFAVAQKDVIHAHRKDLVHGDVLVDDKPSHVESWSMAHPNGLGILWDRAYNRESLLPERASSWEELHRRIARHLSARSAA